jgi:hypothetical protein
MWKVTRYVMRVVSLFLYKITVEVEYNRHKTAQANEAFEIFWFLLVSYTRVFDRILLPSSQLQNHVTHASCLPSNNRPLSKIATHAKTFISCS